MYSSQHFPGTQQTFKVAALARAILGAVVIRREEDYGGCEMDHRCEAPVRFMRRIAICLDCFSLRDELSMTIRRLHICSSMSRASAAWTLRDYNFCTTCVTVRRWAFGSKAVVAEQGPNVPVVGRQPADCVKALSHKRQKSSSVSVRRLTWPLCRSSAHGLVSVREL